MIAVLQFDGVSRIHLEKLLTDGQLPALNSLRSRGTWYELETPATHFEGAAAYSLSTGVNLGEHGLYYPWLWSATEQRVRFYDEVPAPEAVWERIGRWASVACHRSLRDESPGDHAGAVSHRLAVQESGGPPNAFRSRLHAA